MQYMPANGDDHAYNKLTWHPIEMLDQKHFKQSMALYGLHSPCIKEMVNNWVTQPRVIPQDWKGLISAVLEAEQQL